MRPLTNLKEQGFSLIECVVMLVLIAIGASMSAFVLSNAQLKALDLADNLDDQLAVTSCLERVIAAYKWDTSSTLSFDDLLTKCNNVKGTDVTCSGENTYVKAASSGGDVTSLSLDKTYTSGVPVYYLTVKKGAASVSYIFK